MKSLRRLVANATTIYSQKNMCSNAQHENPILNYEFYLRLEKHKYEDAHRSSSGTPIDPRSALQNELNEQNIKRWVYDANTKISIGWKQLEWILKSQIICGSYSPVVTRVSEEFLGETTGNNIKEILSECYVFDCKEYERSIKVPADPDDRWNPYSKKMFLDYPGEQRLTRNMFTSVLRSALNLSRVISAEASCRTFTSFDSPIQAMYDRGNMNSILLRQDNCLNFMSSKSLPLISNKEEVKSTENYKFDDFYPLNPLLDFKYTDLYNDYESFGVASKESKDEFFPHTSFLPAVTAKSDRMQYAVCFVAFSNALTKARHLYGSEELDLETPIVAQCVGSTGFDLHFATCQLNTTRFGDDEGVKNMIWVQPNISFYKSVRREFDLLVDGYNASAGLTLMAHVMNGLVNDVN